jgi:hypothetical protein
MTAKVAALFELLHRPVVGRLLTRVSSHGRSSPYHQDHAAAPTASKTETPRSSTYASRAREPTRSARTPQPSQRLARPPSCGHAAAPQAPCPPPGAEQPKSITAARAVGQRTIEP